MPFELPKLPYSLDALEPHISARTMEFHHGKHHKAYVEKLNSAIADTPYQKMALEEIIQKAAKQPDHAAVFNNAAQHWNHAFFWRCMKPGGGGAPGGELGRRIADEFGSLDGFRDAFLAAATSRFGSGWAWLVADAGKLHVISTPNAEPPMIHGRVALLTCDVWEHAYYLDYQNQRGRFVEAFLDKLVDWDFATKRFAERDKGL